MKDQDRNKGNMWNMRMYVVKIVCVTKETPTLLNVQHTEPVIHFTLPPSGTLINV